jgi:hypothetical protein
MSQDAVRKEMDEAWAKAREELLAVMAGAPPNSIISGTEWQVREIQQKLARECFQIMAQSKLDSTLQGAFSPTTGAGSASGRVAPTPDHHDQRRDHAQP